MRIALCSLVVGLLLLGRGAHAQSVPQTISFSGYFEDAGAPLEGPHDFDLALWSTPTGGSAALWTDSLADAVVTGGYVDLPLDIPSPIFTGASFYLEIEIDGTVLSPRVEVGSVPYAMRAGMFGPYAPADLQERVDGVCAAGAAMTAVGANGGVTCLPFGDITGVTTNAGSGLTGGVASGTPTLAMMSCAPGSAPIMGALGYACGPVGDITAVLTNSGSGLVGGVTGGNAVLGLENCPAGQALVDVSAGSAAYQCQLVGDITSVTAAPSGGLSTGGTAGTSGDIALSLASCPVGQILKANPPGAGYSCAPDANTAAAKGTFVAGPVSVGSGGFSLAAVPSNIPAFGYVTIHVQVAWNNPSATPSNRLQCWLTDGPQLVFFNWDAGDADDQIDQSQSFSFVVQASAGVHNYGLGCQTFLGQVTAHNISMVVQYAPNTL